MRDALRTLPLKEASHFGLAYDVLAPIKPGEGKVPDQERDVWLQRLEDFEIPPDYRIAFERWRTSFPDNETHEVELVARLLVGHGNPSPTEVGLTVHRTWGVPIIPGSALKGLLAHYLPVGYGPDRYETHPMDPRLSGEAASRARFQGVTWKNGRIVHGPGEVHRTLLGAPSAPDDREFKVGACKGLVEFHDALMVPGSVRNRPFSQDVLTVHQKEYYNHKGKGAAPNDYDSPNPVGFITVKPGTRFLLALSGPREWVAFAMEHLLEALAEWGVGGKTSAGYGRIKPSAGDPDAPLPAPRSQQAPASRQVLPGARPVPHAAATLPSPAPGTRVRAVLLEEKTSKGGWKAKVGEYSGHIEGEAPAGITPAAGMEVDLEVKATSSDRSKKQVVFRWPKPPAPPARK
jgi:CRISPR-associated protein Cmr6